jgi:hypothetical protein
MALPGQLTLPGPQTFPGMHVGETIQDYEQINLFPSVSLYPSEPPGLWPSFPGSEPLVFDAIPPVNRKRYYIRSGRRVVR